MSDHHPETFAIEIEREKLCRYWRLQWLLGTGMICALFGGLFGMAWATNPEHRQEYTAVTDVAIGIITGIGGGTACGGVFVVLAYLVFYRRRARQLADRLNVIIEGPYLRIQQGVSLVRDRKLHFRSIVDYSYFEDPLMRYCTIGGVMLTTTAGGRDTVIRIHGVKDALAVRDMLSEIDRSREDR